MDFPALVWEEFGKQNDSRDVQGSGVETDLFFFFIVNSHVCCTTNSGKEEQHD